MSIPRTSLRELNIARSQLEVFLGSDNIVRINVDGACALRVRLEPGCELALRQRESEGGITITIPRTKK